MPQSDTAGQESGQEAEAGEAPAKDSLPLHHDEVGETQRAAPSTNCSFSGPIKLEVARWMESKVEVVQCPACGSVSKTKLKEQSVVIAPHPPRKSRSARNVTHWAEQRSDWVLVQKAEKEQGAREGDEMKQRQPSIMAQAISFTGAGENR